MATDMLHLGPDLAFPLDAATQTFALLAVRRAGKSNAAAVLAEEMHAAGLPWVAIDPKGDWWGLRSAGDGTRQGLPVPIFGGLHGDMPLAPEAGPLIAELIVDENLTCILDVSDFASMAAQMRFLTDLGERLFRLHGKRPTPRHVFLEEADDVIPQSPRAEMARCTGAWTKLVKQGGSRGLGITIISQRSAVVAKDALTQVETMIALRTTSPQDRKAIRGWVDYHDVAGELVDSLPRLGDGEAWVCSPHWLARHGQLAIQRSKFRQRSTFDSGATPTLEPGRAPATLADIDLGAVVDRMEAVVAKAAQDDPRALRRTVADLQRRLAAGAAAEQKIAALETELSGVRSEFAAVLALNADAVAGLERSVATLLAVADAVGGHASAIAGRLGRADVTVPVAPAALPAVPPRSLTPAAKPAKPPMVPSAEAVSPPIARQRDDGPVALKAGARNMLGLLARWHPLKVTRHQLAVQAGIKTTGSTFSAYLSNLRTGGLIAEDGKMLGLTEAGIAEAGVDVNLEPMTPAEVLDMWRSVLKAGARSMLDHLVERYPDWVTRDELAATLGIDRSGSTFSAYLSNLRTNDLAEVNGSEIRASDALFLGGSGG
jgi:hypothetical protein